MTILPSPWRQHWHLETDMERKNPIAAGIRTYVEAQEVPSTSTQSVCDDTVCAACGSGASIEENQIVFCDSCNVAVHQVWRAGFLTKASPRPKWTGSSELHARCCSCVAGMLWNPKSTQRRLVL